MFIERKTTFLEDTIALTHPVFNALMILIIILGVVATVDNALVFSLDKSVGPKPGQCKSGFAKVGGDCVGTYSTELNAVWVINSW